MGHRHRQSIASVRKRAGNQYRWGCAIRKLAILILFLPSLCVAGRYWSEDEVASLDIVTDLSLNELTGDLTFYYVDGGSGSDSNTGLSYTSAFKTIAKALDRYSSRPYAGRVIIISSGTYYESIAIGNPTNTWGGKRFYVGPYGNGEVIVSGEIYPRNAWSLLTGSIYVSTQAKNIGGVVVDDYPLMHYPSSDTMKAGTWYNNETTDDLFVWLLDGTDITSHDYQLVEKGTGGGGTIYPNLASSVTVYGITERCNPWNGVRNEGDDNYYYKCQIKYNYYSGFNKEGTSDRIKIEKCLSEWNMLANWPRGQGGYAWGNWGTGIGGSNWHDAEISGCISRYNGGEGFTCYGNDSTPPTTKNYNLHYHDNIAQDNYSVGLYADNIYGPVMIERNFSYCTELYKSTDTVYPDLTDEEIGKATRYQRQEGIMTADEDYTGDASLSSATIRNNLIINCRRGITYYGEDTNYGEKVLKVHNNTIITPNHKSYGYEDEYRGIQHSNGGATVGCEYKNNIVYASSSSYCVYNTSTAARPPFYQQTWANNIFYHDTRTSPFLYGTTAKTYSEWTNLDSPAQNSGGSYDNPDLYDVQWTNFYSSMTYLTAGSPAINAGADLSAFFTDDFFEATRNTFDIGAHEYDGTTGGTENTPKRMWWFKGGMFK